MNLFRVSVLNVGRNKRRSLITILTVFIGVTVALGARGLLNGLQKEIRDGLIRKMHGELQVHAHGYQDSLESNPYKMLVPFPLQGLARPEIEAIAPRLKIMGLVNHQKSQTTTPVVISGIDSVQELAVCPRLKDSIVSGTVLNSEIESPVGGAKARTDENLEEAQGLDAAPAKRREPSKPRLAAEKSNASSEVHQILVTPGLMRGFGAELGDEVVVLVQDRNNMQQAVIAKIVGVVDYAMPAAASRMAWMDFKTLQTISGTQGQASEIAVRTSLDPDTLKPVLARDLGEARVVETWLELSGFFRDAMGIQNAVFSVVLFIIFTIMISAIVNTSLMTVMERTREIGTLMALGYRRNHILNLFLGEFAVIGLLGGVAGVLLSSLLLGVLMNGGLHFTLPGQTVAVTLYPYVTIRFGLFVLALAVAASLGAGLYPAYRASRQRPVQALSSV